MKKGKQCPGCGMINVQGAYQCGSCGTNIEEIKAALYNDSQFNKPVEPSASIGGASKQSEHPNSSYYETSRTRYGTARLVANGIEFIGWLIVVAGIIAIVMLLSNMGSRYFNLAGILPGVGTLISGLFMIMGAQVTKATVDNADNTRELVALMHRQMTKDDD